jgi:hypothetical protein
MGDGYQFEPFSFSVVLDVDYFFPLSSKKKSI